MNENLHEETAQQELHDTFEESPSYLKLYIAQAVPSPKSAKNAKATKEEVLSELLAKDAKYKAYLVRSVYRYNCTY